MLLGSHQYRGERAIKGRSAVSRGLALDHGKPGEDAKGKGFPERGCLNWILKDAQGWAGRGNSVAEPAPSWRLLGKETRSPGALNAETPGGVGFTPGAGGSPWGWRLGNTVSSCATPPQPYAPKPASARRRQRDGGGADRRRSGAGPLSQDGALSPAPTQYLHPQPQAFVWAHPDPRPQTREGRRELQRGGAHWGEGTRGVNGPGKHRSSGGRWGVVWSSAGRCSPGVSTGSPGTPGSVTFE